MLNNVVKLATPGAGAALVAGGLFPHAAAATPCTRPLPDSTPQLASHFVCALVGRAVISRRPGPCLMQPTVALHAFASLPSNCCPCLV